jgi:hypothetical protein
VQARVIGSAVAGMSELLIFHPVVNISTLFNFNIYTLRLFTLHLFFFILASDNQDTVAKRLMMSHEQLFVAGNTSASMSNLNNAIFQKSAQATVFQKWKVRVASLPTRSELPHSRLVDFPLKSLFPGLGFGAGYKVMQRVYKFGGQPFVK